jgi:hypothetical protein
MKELGDTIIKSETSSYKIINLNDDGDNLYLTHTPDNGGFSYFAGNDFVWYEDTPKVDYVCVWSEGWAAFDGIRHITTYWNYIDWEFGNRYYNLLKLLENNICSDFTGERLETETEFELTIKEVAKIWRNNDHSTKNVRLTL